MLLIKVSFVEKIRVQAEYIFNAAAVCFEMYSSGWLHRRFSPSFCHFFMFSFSDLLRNICFFVRSHVSVFSFPSWSCFVPFCFCLSAESASHAFLSRTLCFMSAFQPLNHISVTSYCTHTHTHADTSCCGSHAKNFLLTEFLLPLLSALLFAQSSQHSLFWCDPSNRKAFSVYQNTLEEHRELFTWYTSKKVQQDAMFVSRQIYLTVLYGPKRNIQIWRNIYNLWCIFLSFRGLKEFSCCFACFSFHYDAIFVLLMISFEFYVIACCPVRRRWGWNWRGITWSHGESEQVNRQTLPLNSIRWDEGKSSDEFMSCLAVIVTLTRLDLSDPTPSI